jgi:hypothetical protein
MPRKKKNLAADGFPEICPGSLREGMKNTRRSLRDGGNISMGRVSRYGFRQ